MSTTTTTDLAVELASWKHPDGSYVLGDAVRVPCHQTHNKMVFTSRFSLAVSGATCAEVDCPGFTPSARLEDWLEVARAIRFPNTTPAPLLWPGTKDWLFSWPGKSCQGKADTPIEAIQLALKKVKEREETT